MFKSHITKTLYQDFLADYSLKPFKIDARPFVLVDQETGSIQLLAGSYDGLTRNDYSPLSIMAPADKDDESTVKS